MKKLVFVIVMVLWISVNSIAGENEMVMNDFSLADMLNMEIYSAGKKAEKVIEVPASVKIITREEIQMYGYRTLIEVLEHVPGLYNLTTLTQPRGNFGVRGTWTGRSPNSNIAFLVNGVNQNDYRNNSNSFSKITVPVEVIDRIEIIKGPMAVIYGSGASQGVINIITNASEEDHGVNLVAGSLGWEQKSSGPSQGMTAKYTDGEGDFNLNINASFHKDPGPDIKFRKMINNAEGVLMNPLYGVMDMEHSTDKLLESEHKYFNLAALYQDFYFNASYNEVEQECFYIIPSLDHGTMMKHKTTNIMIGLQKNPLEDLEIDYKLRYFESNRGWDYDGLNVNFWNHTFYTLRGYELELINVWSLLDNLDATIGLSYTVIEKKENYNDAYVPFDDKMNYLITNDDPIETRSLFTQIDYQAVNNLKFVLGLRIDNAASQVFHEDRYDPDQPSPTYPLVGTIDRQTSRSKTQNIFNGRLAAIYSMNDHNIVKLLYGEATRNHTEVFWSEDKNPDPEKTRTIELNHIFTERQITVTSGIFWSTVENLMLAQRTYDPQGGGYVATRSYDGESETMGTELSVTVQPLPMLSTEISISYQEAQNSDNDEIAYAPKLLGQFKAGYNFGICLASVTAFYMDQIESEWDPTKKNSDESFGRYLGDKSDDYFLLGANLRFVDLYEGLYLNIRGSNLLNTKIRYPAIQANSMLDKGTIGPGIACTITLGWEF